MSEVSAPSVLRLRDGRAVAYREWGDPDGSPVVFVHGSPGSGVWSPDPKQDATRACRVRLITVDRPGLGGSDVLPGLTLGRWVVDVAELADGLGLGRFGVVGISAGGPWAAACAALIPERLTGVGLASSRALGAYNLRERPQAGVSPMIDIESGKSGWSLCARKIRQRSPSSHCTSAPPLTVVPRTSG